MADGESDAVPKILDFGLAVARDANFSDKNRLTRPGAALGTLGYMSREQFFGETVDERADIYAMGVIALEVVSGFLDSKGPSFSRVAGVLKERLETEDASPQQRQLAEVLAKALSERKEGRFAAMHELREALLPVLRQCPPIAHAQTQGRIDDASLSPLSGLETVAANPDLGDSPVEAAPERRNAAGAGPASQA
jgi:serine/threonine protein kinase